MNALDALRLSDPGRELAQEPLDDRSERLLRAILASPIDDARATETAARSPHRRSSGRDRRPLLVTIAVAALIAGGAFAVIRSVPSVDHRGSPAATQSSSSSQSDLEDALFARLPADARTQPALTWTEADPGAQGDGFDLAGRSVQLAAACDGGGTITITISGRRDTLLTCAQLSSVGPIALDSDRGLSVGVSATAGHPRYLVEAVAIPNSATPTSTSAAGCPATDAHMPAGARTARIVDVDGDGKADTEWSTLVDSDLRFGITTASGATISATEDFAGGGNRSFVAARLANGAVVLMPSEGRATGLWSLSGCSLHEVRSGSSATGDVTGFFGISIAWNDDGGAATCIGGRLASLSWKADGTSTDAVTARFIDVSEDGATATLTDSTTVIARHVVLGSAFDAHYSGISCGTSPVLDFG